MKQLNLNTIRQELDKFDKVIVTGPPRSGTTIATIITANILNYKFIDESFYDANDKNKFLWLLSQNRKMVIQMTAFFRDLHNIGPFLTANNTAVVLVKRNIEAILESFENSKNFTMPAKTSDGLFTMIDEEAQNIIFKHYMFKKEDKRSLPEKVYDYFYGHMDGFNKHMLFELHYKDLKKHKLFVKKADRRKHFKHIKQVKVDDPYYLQNQILVLQGE